MVTSFPSSNRRIRAVWNKITTAGELQPSAESQSVTHSVSKCTDQLVPTKHVLSGFINHIKPINSSIYQEESHINTFYITPQSVLTRFVEISKQQYRQRNRNVTLQRVRVMTVAVEKQ